MESRFADNEAVKTLKPGETVVINEGDGDHFINYCSCGKTMGQCRCGSPNKKITVTKDGCPDCQAALESRSAEHPLGRPCGCKAAPLQARDATTEKLLDHVLENLTGVSSKWLGGVKPVFRELLAKAQDSTVTDTDLVKAIELARRDMPELFAKLDTKELVQAFERTAGAAVINGVVRGHMARPNPKPETKNSELERTR